MNAITPAKGIPPAHRTAASGTLPIEQTKLATAISGPISARPHDAHRARRVVQEEAVEDVLPSSAMKPASRKPIVISFHSISQSARKLPATCVQASSELTRSRQLAGSAALSAA